MSMIGGNNNIGQIQGTQGPKIDAHDKKLSIADLNTLVMMERSEILDRQIRDQIETVKSKNDQMKMLGQIQTKLAGKLNNTQAVNENTWSVDHGKDPKEIALDNGYKIQIHGKNESWSIVDANGNNTKVWGDPHVGEGDKDGNKNWDFQEDATFVLEDGTKITCKCTDKGGSDKNVFSDELIITKGNQAIKVTGIADNEPKIGNPTLDGAAVDAASNDGYVFKMGDQADDWSYQGNEIGKDGWVNVTAGKGALINEDNSMKQHSDNINNLLTPEERNLLDQLGVNIEDASGGGILNPNEINNLIGSIKNAKETLTSMSQLDMVTLQSITGKYEQTNALASQVMKQMYSQTKELIRNIG